MNEETLQSEVESAPIESAEVDNADPIQETLDSAPNNADETASESETNEAVNQEKINKVINKKHFEKMEAERKAEQYKAELAEYQRKEQESLQQRINNIPEMPDVYDDDYDQKLAQRDKAIHEKAMFDAQQNIYQRQQQEIQQKAQYEQQQEVAKKEQAFLENANKQGVSKEEIGSLLGTIGQYGGIGQDNAQALLSDKDAPLIIKYLAANPQEIGTMQQMNGYSLANHVNQNIRAKALALKPKQSSAPNPATNINGNGADPEAGRYALIDGYEIE